MLSSRYAMWLGWGPELTFFYNDAYAKMTLGAKHPWALGRPAHEVWAEIWDTLKIRIDHVLRTGEATWDEGLQLMLVRSGYLEETYHTFSYSVAPGDARGEIGGLFCVVIEETERVINERRIAFLRDLASRISQTHESKDVYAALEYGFVEDARDVPFSAAYLVTTDGATARRVSRAGFSKGHPTLPAEIDVTASSVWPIRAIIETGREAVVDLPGGISWPTGPWQQSPSQALVLPIPQQGQVRPAGVFIAGVNPHRPLDAAVRSFLSLVVGQFAAGLSNAIAYEQTQRRAETLAELDRAKTTFFSNVSHEFRTPLTLMLGPIEDALAAPDGDLDGEDLETVHRNALRLLKLVNGLLDFARIEAGRIEASYEPLDLRQLTVDLASTFRSAIERAGLVFDVQCSELPERIYVDRDMWEKIVLNLLSNALKFTFDGAVRVLLDWRSDHVELVVEDTGVGIEPAELPRLFERFHRIEGTRARTHEGSGIGLALIHELVRLHGGRIDVKSEVGSGTRFVVSVPTGKDHLVPERITAPQPLRRSTAGTAYVTEALRWVPAERHAEYPLTEAAASRCRILVVDDNADMRGYIARLLRPHWAVYEAADGLSAFELAKQVQPDLILSDVMMPQLDGFGLVRELRKDPKTATTSVILVSARAGEEATAEGLRSGADDYLVKPFSAGALLVRVEAQLAARRLREALRHTAESERERLELMFRESPAAICVLRGRDFIIELANPLVLRLWNKGDVLGQPLFEVIPELREQGFDELLRHVLETGTAHQGKEVLAKLRDEGNAGDREVYFDFVYVALPGPNGAPDSIFVHAYDVTDKVLARQNLEKLREAERRARREAEVANRLKDEFLATMSHELRTPLNAILGWASLVRQSKARDSAILDQGLATIERNARAQQRLIEDILDVSRIISGKLSLDLKRIDLVAIARSALDVVRPAAGAKQVKLLFEPADGVLNTIGDADRFQQIVWNLLSNAVKFTTAGGLVSLKIERVASSARIVVRDTGVGIASEHLPYIFERFRQVDSSTTRKYSGLGLGLAIVRHLAELHGGFVVAESAGPNQGATFTVQVPIPAIHDVPASNENAALPLHEPPTHSPLGSLEGITVLVTDDDEDSRVLLEAALGRAGATVKCASSANAALELIATQPIDVLVSDIGMPEEDGYSLLRRLRALDERQKRQIPAIALTAYARPEDASTALKAGFQYHLPKPADVEQLTRVVLTLSRRTA